MPLMKLIEQQGLDSGEFRILNHVPEQNAFCLELDLRRRTHNTFEPDPVPNFPAQVDIQLPCNPGCEKTCRQTPWLENYGLAMLEESVFPKDLWNLRGFSRTRGRLKNEAPVRLERRDDFFLNVVDR
jgi:hypothetical protein